LAGPDGSLRDHEWVLQTSDRWPPANTHEEVFLLDGLSEAATTGGRLLAPGRHAHVSAEPARVDWIHDPRDPVRYLPLSEFAQCADLPDESPLHLRPDVLTFDSDAVSSPVDLIGKVSFTGVVSAETKNTHVVARLLDRYPNGTARLIAEGGAIANTEGGPTTVTVTMRETAYRLRPGHALRLALSTSCFPLYAVHPGHDGDLWDLSKLVPQRQTLLSQPDRRSSLSITVRRR
jgi:putative CocE/NonD family hydrolase